MSSIIFAKLDPGFFGNRKVIRAGRNGREVFLFALCMNASRGAKGSIPAADLEPWYVAHQLSIPESDAAEGLQRATDAGLLRQSGDCFEILGWDQDWSRRAKTGAERSASWRDRNGDTVTRDSQSDAQRIRGEKSRSEQSDHDVTLDLPLPADWRYSDEHSRLAASLGLDVEREAADLRLYAASKGWKRRDWGAAFARWLNKSENRKTPKQQRQRASVRVPSFDSTGKEITVEHEPDGDDE